jgi:hypothetical protein
MRSDMPVAFPVYGRPKPHFRECTPTGVKPFGSRVRIFGDTAQKVTTKTNFRRWKDPRRVAMSNQRAGGH